MAKASLQIRPYRISDETRIIDLWKKCDLIRPWNDPQKDINRKLKVQPDWFLIGELEGELIASAMAGYDGHRGWVYYLAVSPDYRKKGYGREIMGKVERLLENAGCPKINLMVRSSNMTAVSFYHDLGYEVDEVVNLGKRLDRDD